LLVKSGSYISGVRYICKRNSSYGGKLEVSLLYKKEIMGSSPLIVRSLINDMMNCIRNWNSLSDDDEYEFRLVLNELICNGVFHGNKGCSNKKVKVRIEEVDSVTLDIWVKDEGGGFDYNKVFKNYYNRKPYFLLAESGRGLLLVKAMCNNIQFNNNGSLIRIRKSINKKIL